MVKSSIVTQTGDSGAPVFNPTTKNMVGMVVGKGMVDGQERILITEWSEAKKRLGFTSP